YGLFAVSVAENVLMRGNVSEDDKAKVVDALEKSGVWKKVSELPKGVDTTVTKEFDKEGAVFSGGETQKISIASVFAGENEIVIMDEPTSALDPIAEQEMYENMFKACEGKTVIFISHRLSATTYADRIYMFEQGEIIEQGTHHELLALNGKFADMWHKQADSYIMEGVDAE
ncbi:MAG: ATP-binding cassette domain-containing protein, partial [Clostridia bacterium]|nr:ATP-binding cassette domain-containing protein [Clostridia bacterium]